MSSSRTWNKSRRGTAIATAVLSMALVGPFIQPIAAPQFTATASAQQVQASGAYVHPTDVARLTYTPGDPAANAIVSDVAAGANNSVNGFVIFQRAGNLNVSNSTPVANSDIGPIPMEGVRVYAQWIDRFGKPDESVSPVYTAVTKADGSFNIGMLSYMRPDGTTVSFDADPNLPAGEKIRVWAENPDTGALQELYTYGNGTVSPATYTYDSTAGATQLIGPNQWNGVKIAFGEKPAVDTMHDMSKASENAFGNYGGVGRGGVTGRVWYDNSTYTGAQTWSNPAGMGLSLFPAGIYGTTGAADPQADMPLEGIKVYASYLSDYAVDQIYSRAATELGFSGIRDGSWTTEKEAVLQNWIQQQIAKEGKGLWIAETAVATTGADGNYQLQFKGTWNNSAPAGETPNTVDEAQRDYWSAKHVNTEWMFMSTQQIDGMGQIQPFYQNYYSSANNWGQMGIGSNNGWAVTNSLDAIKNMHFALFSEKITLDVQNYDSQEHFAAPGDSAPTNVTGLPPQLGVNAAQTQYVIEWVNQNTGQVVQTSDPVAPDATGSIPSYPLQVPADLSTTTTYVANLYPIGPNGTRGSLIASDSFTAVAPYDPNYADTPVPAGQTSVTSVLPTFDQTNTKDTVETLSTSDVATALKSTITYSLPAAADGNGISMGIYPGTLTEKDFTIDPNTGAVTWNNVAWPVDQNGNEVSSIKVPVVVNYGNGNSGVTWATFTKAQTDSLTPTAPLNADGTPKSDPENTPVSFPAVTFPTGQTAPAGTTYAVTGLPDGLTVDPATGVISGTTPSVDANTDYPIQVTVTYPDGSTDVVNYTYTVTNAADQTNGFTPDYADVTTTAGTPISIAAPTAPEGALPQGTTFASTSLPAGATIDPNTGAISIPGGLPAGTTTIPVTVTYPDGSTDSIDVVVTVNPAQSQADQFTPVGQNQTITQGSTPKPENSIANSADLPAGTTYTWKTPVDTTTTGDQPATVVVTYPDGTTDEVPVTITVTAAPTQADQNTPVGKDQTVTQGTAPKPEDSIANVADLPQGTTFQWQAPVDTTKAGDQPATVTVVYPDGSIDEVPVTVHVTADNATTYTPVGQNQTIAQGGTPKPENSIANSADLPAGTTYTWKTPVDTTTTGDQPATVVVTYPDGTVDEVPVTITVTATPTQADQNTPVGQNQTVTQGTAPKPEDSIANVADLPQGTTFQWQAPVDTTKTGDQPATVTVVYPDGSIDEVPVTITVTPAQTQADQFTPTGKDQTVTQGTAPKPEDSISNIADLPQGTTITWKDPVNTDTTGTQQATVVVTYPDGSVDEVPVTITVNPAPTTQTQADQFTPTGQDQTVTQGTAPKPEGSIANLGDLPAGTTVTFKDPVDTSNPGTQQATVVVTYPDGSVDEVPVTITVNPANILPGVSGAVDQTVVSGQPMVDEQLTVTGDAPVVTVTGLPDGVTFDAATNTISGTPVVTDWKDDAAAGTFEESRDFNVTVTVSDQGDTPAESTVKITVLRDTDGDGVPDITDTDDDNDGFTDTQELAQGTNPKDANSVPTVAPEPFVTFNDGAQVTEGQKITPIPVKVDNLPTGATVAVDGLPGGLSYNPATGAIEGTPTKLSDWGKTEESRTVPVTITVTSPDGSTIKVEATITVLRDTDGDGIPDTIDNDDDNDGFTDAQEAAAGTDSKDANSKPETTVTDHSGKDNGTATDGKDNSSANSGSTNAADTGSSASTKDALKRCFTDPKVAVYNPLYWLIPAGILTAVPLPQGVQAQLDGAAAHVNNQVNQIAGQLGMKNMLPSFRIPAELNINTYLTHDQQRQLLGAAMVIAGIAATSLYFSACTGTLSGQSSIGGSSVNDSNAQATDQSSDVKTSSAGSSN